MVFCGVYDEERSIEEGEEKMEEGERQRCLGFFDEVINIDYIECVFEFFE